VKQETRSMAGEERSLELEDRQHRQDENRSTPSEEKTLEQVLDSIPVGWFHYRLLFICGLAFMADGMV
jgi:hypothetical protein